MIVGEGRAPATGIGNELSPVPAASEPVRSWEARCRKGGDDARWPSREAFELLEALRQHIVAGEESRLRRASQAWARANPTVAILLRRLASLRELFSDEGISRLPELNDRFQRALDLVTAVATEAATAALADAAMTDTLTGVGNRRALEDTGQSILREASDKRELVSVAVIDLKGLKEINDTQGHAAGDKALAGFAASLGAAMRDTDRLFRVGGDEFVLLLPGASREAAAKVMARAESFNAPDFSWGAATFPLEAEDLDSLLGLADGRLYQSRRDEGYYERRSAFELASPAALSASVPAAPASERRRRKPLLPLAFGSAAVVGLFFLASVVKPAPGKSLPPSYAPTVSLTMQPNPSATTLTPVASNQKTLPATGPVPASGSSNRLVTGPSTPPPAGAPATPPSTGPATSTAPATITTPPTSPPTTAGGPPSTNQGKPPNSGSGNGHGNGHGTAKSAQSASPATSPSPAASGQGGSAKK
ncbi:MAG TPA: GGDEF domain-containing protein [Acidimicrobiales bacterium]